MQTQGYFISATLKVKDNQRVEEAKQALHELCRTTEENEAGCIFFQLYQSSNEPTCFLLWECFESETAFHLHHQLPHTLAFKEKELTEVVQAQFLDRV